MSVQQIVSTCCSLLSGFVCRLFLLKRTWQPWHEKKIQVGECTSCVVALCDKRKQDIKMRRQSWILMQKNLLLARHEEQNEKYVPCSKYFSKNCFAKKPSSFWGNLWTPNSHRKLASAGSIFAPFLWKNLQKRPGFFVETSVGCYKAAFLIQKISYIHATSDPSHKEVHNSPKNMSYKNISKITKRRNKNLGSLSTIRKIGTRIGNRRLIDEKKWRRHFLSVNPKVLPPQMMMVQYVVKGRGSNKTGKRKREKKDRFFCASHALSQHFSLLTRKKERRRSENDFFAHIFLVN